MCSSKACVLENFPLKVQSSMHVIVERLSKRTFSPQSKESPSDPFDTNPEPSKWVKVVPKKKTFNSHLKGLL